MPKNTSIMTELIREFGKAIGVDLEMKFNAPLEHHAMIAAFKWLEENKGDIIWRRCYLTPEDKAVGKKTEDEYCICVIWGNGIATHQGVSESGPLEAIMRCAIEQAKK